MSHLLDELLAQASNGSPITAALSAESVAVLFFASEFLGLRENWLDRGVDPLDEVTDADWDAIEKLVGNVYEELMTPVIAVGALEMWLTATPPERWLICNGQDVSRTTYAELFALWGTTFGVGNGTTTFNLPDMRSLHPKGAGGVIALGAVAGSSVVHLTTSQLPTHNHGINDPGHDHGPLSPLTNFVGARTGGNLVVPNGSTVGVATKTASNTTGITTQNVGLGDAINTAQPSMGVNYIVYAGV